MELNSSAEETALHSAFVPDDGDQPDNSPARMFERSRLSERRDGKVHDSADASQAELDSPAGEPAQDPQRPLVSH